LGGFKSLLLGSVSEQVVHHAAGPPFDRPQRHGKIVVGVDGSEPSIAALTWAIDEGRRWDASVLAVAVMPLRSEAAPASVGLTASSDVDSARAVLEEGIRRAGGGCELFVERYVTYGQPAGVLRKLAADATLLVVGSSGLEGFPGLLLGSVGSQCVPHAPCPTVVMRAT
jgi:nucleotide-binding universal stress UspA family protein